MSQTVVIDGIEINYYKLVSPNGKLVATDENGDPIIVRSVKQLENESHLDWYKRCCKIIIDKKCTSDMQTLKDVLYMLHTGLSMIINNKEPYITEYSKAYEEMKNSEGFKLIYDSLDDMDKLIIKRDPLLDIE